MLTVKSFEVGECVKIHPSSDLYMKGVAYATVEKVGREYIHIWHAWSGRRFKVRPRQLMK